MKAGAGASRKTSARPRNSQIGTIDASRKSKSGFADPANRIDAMHNSAISRAKLAFTNDKIAS